MKSVELRTAHASVITRVMVPPAWRDAAITTIRAPASPDGTAAPAIRVWSEPLAAGDDARSHAEKILLNLAHRGENVTLVRSETRNVAGRPAIVHCVRFGTKRGAVEQTTVTLPASDDPSRVVVFALSTMALNAGETLPVFYRLLDSVRACAPRA